MMKKRSDGEKWGEVEDGTSRGEMEDLAMQQRM